MKEIFYYLWTKYICTSLNEQKKHRNSWLKPSDQDDYKELDSSDSSLQGSVLVLYRALK